MTVELYTFDARTSPTGAREFPGRLRPVSTPEGDVGALIDTADGVAALVERLRPVRAIAFDLEFLSQDRYAPTLCLIQLGWQEPGQTGTGAPDAPVEVRLVDALAVDVRPLVALLGDGRTVIAHGARQDAGLLASQFGVRIARLFDTQVAAAFLGHGDQIGYGKLAAALVGAVIDKDSQWTDWDRRPLSARQLRYAIADVAHLPAIHRRLADRLGERLAWVLAESAAIVDEAVTAAAIAGDQAWRAIGAARTLDALIELAAWRHRTAVAEDLPLGHVVAERTLVELARARPRDARALRRVRGANELRDRDAAVLTAIAAGAERAETGEVPVLTAGQAASPRVELWTDIVLAVVAAAAQTAGIAPRFLATRADAEALCRAIDRAAERGQPLDAVDHPLFTSWRRGVVGDALVGWFGGNAALAIDLTVPSGIQIR
jgi:ribonuclease D